MSESQVKNDVGVISNDFEKLSLNADGHLVATVMQEGMARPAR